MSRLCRRAWTGGGSVSRRQARPDPAALSPGSDRWWLRHRPHTGRHPLACPNGTNASGQSHHPSCMSVDSVRHQRSWAKSPPCCMSVRHPWAMSTLKYRTVSRKIGSMFSHLNLGPMAASQRLLHVCLTAIKLQIHCTIFMCRAPSTAVDDTLWHGADVDSSLTACKFKKVILCAMNI